MIDRPRRPPAPARHRTGVVRGALLLLLAGGIVGCSGPAEPPPVAPRPGRGPLDAEARAWVDRALASLSLEEAAAQLVIPWIPGAYASDGDPEMLQELGWVERGIGGVSISIGLPDSYVSKLNRLQARARIPLLVTSDFENGGPGMRISGVFAVPSLLDQGGGTAFPPTMAFGAIGEERWAEIYGRVTAREARAVGVHMIFAPVLDVNNNPANPVINVRSFGESPDLVSRLGVAFIRGAREGGVLTTAKHFPGHGDTGTDSHIELPVIPADRARMGAVELPPFQAAVDAGVDAVMTAHVAVPHILGEDGPPATLSPYFMTDLLRAEMGFTGLLFTDALRMGAITRGYGAGEAGVLALEAGSDVILAPEDVGVTIDAVVEAVGQGRLSRERIDRSVRRILEAKAAVGLHRGWRIDPGAVSGTVGSLPHRAWADSAAALSLTLPRDREDLLPVDPNRARRILSVTFARDDDLLAGRAFDARLALHVENLGRARVDPSTPWSAYDSLALAARDADLVVLGTYVAPRSGLGSVAVPPELTAFLREVSGRRPTVVVSFGNPYLLTAFPHVGTYLIAWGTRETSQVAAARALVGEVGIQGRLPVTIPELHERGEGLTRFPLESVALGEDRVIDPLAEAGFVPGRGSTETETVADTSRVGLMEPARVWDAHPARDPTPCPVGAPVPGPAQSPDAGPPEDLTAGCLDGDVVRSLLESDPSLVGMSASALNELDRILLRALADSAAPGAALAVGRRGRLVRLRGYGRLDWDPRAPRVTPASLYDLASLTKVVGTTTAAMILVDRGLLELDRPVVHYLPWWAAGDPRKAEVTVRQLLLHRAGLPPFRSFYLEMEGREAYEAAIGALPLESEPGEATVYSDIGLMSVGFIVEAVSGRGLDAFLREEVWAPLGMADTGFNPAPEEFPRVASTELDRLYRGVHVHGVVHDENAYAIGGVVGHAGLFSSVRDLAVFGQMMLDRGTSPPCRPERAGATACHRPRFGPVTVVRPGTVSGWTTRWDGTSSRALGWDTPSEASSAGDHFTSRAFGHTGFTGTSIWIDPDLDVFVVLLTNRVDPTRDNNRHVALRREVHDRVARAITDRVVPRRGETRPGGRP